MASSLSTLSENLLTPGFEKFRETAKHFKAEDLPLVTRKGVYSYEYTDSCNKLEQTHVLKKVYVILLVYCCVWGSWSGGV